MKKYIKNLSLGLTCLLPLAAHASGSVPYIMDATVKAGNNRNYVQGAIFAPLVVGDDNVIFGDIRYMHHLPKSGKKKNSLYDPKSYEANFGLGYRKALDDETILGAATYYDIRNAQISKAIFSQVTLNTHLLTPTWQTHANLYIPVGKKKVTKTESKFSGKGKALNRDIFLTYNQNTLTEKSLTGFDFRLSRNIPGYENVRVGSVFYYFKDKKAISGLGVELNWTMNDNIKFEASYSYDKVRKSNILAGVRFSLPIGKVGKGRAIDELMSTRVERDLDIVTNRVSDDSKNDVRQADMMAMLI
jgi:outer membrane receptor protein involved in Fe transport